MKERGILFSGPMVKALAEGRKTQTRRVIRPQPPKEKVLARCVNGPGVSAAFVLPGQEQPECWRGCPHGRPGDCLWVREAWWQGQGGTWGSNCVVYDADKQIGWTPGTPFDNANLNEFRKRPSIHMPRWASRFSMVLTEVRVERVQDISEADTIAEGSQTPIAYLPKPCQQGVWTERQKFSRLWDSLNAKRGYGWDTNPWVWVLKWDKAVMDRAGR